MGNNILKGKKGIIFGALDENSIAWKTAESVTEAGGSYVLTNAPVALRMGNINILAEKTGSKLIAADATNLYVCTGTYDGSTVIWKKLVLQAI